MNACVFSQLSSDDCGDADLDDANLETQVCCQSINTVYVQSYVSLCKAKMCSTHSTLLPNHSTTFHSCVFVQIQDLMALFSGPSHLQCRKLVGGLGTRL